MARYLAELGPDLSAHSCGQASSSTHWCRCRDAGTTRQIAKQVYARLPYMVNSLPGIARAIHGFRCSLTGKALNHWSGKRGSLQRRNTYATTDLNNALLGFILTGMRVSQRRWPYWSKIQDRS